MYPGGDAGGPTVPHHFYMVVEAVVLHGVLLVTGAVGG